MEAGQLIRAFIFSVLLTTSPALGDVPARLETAFRGWVAENGVSEAVMVVSQRGQQVAQVALNRQVDAPIELASLSKAITAVCAATLIDSGVWSLETTSAEALGFGPAGVTVAQLVTHQSGIGPDRTQALMYFQFGSANSTAALTTQIALNRPAQSGQSGKYLYNNENYAILGEMIAAETGESYVSYCKDAVIIPAGLTTATPSAVTGTYLPYGGWQMSAQDYARFHWYAYGPQSIIGARVPQWPRAVIEGGADYGMGMLQRPSGARYNFWHFGALCFPLRLNIGAYAVMWMDDWSVVAGFNICTSADQRIALDRALSKAVFP
jgi:CubicO group peptidase (beta-lactamase class C family)